MFVPRHHPTIHARRSPLAALAVLAVVLVVPRATPAATDCSTDCTQTTCSVGCSETDVRTAVARANGCQGNPGWAGRTITVDTPGCTIAMVNDAAAAAAVAGSACAGDPEQHAVCLTNDDVTFDGAGAIFVYTGGGLCGQCPGACPAPQPALFTVKGNRNTVRDFTFRYFPEGIHVREGADHTVADVTSDRICEDAITIDKQAGNGHTIRGATLRGSQPADPGRTCVLVTGESGLCGTDKAIQINGGGSTIEQNTIDLISQPVSIGDGTHLVADNSSTGSTVNQNVCQSYTVTSSALVTFRDNTIDFCKFGLNVGSGAVVIAEGNTITNPWISAFNVRGNGRLMGEGNRVRTARAGFSHVSDVQRGLLVVRNGSAARVDFGGGDFAGVSVVDGQACASGGACSAGGNRFCADGAGVQIDIWNVTDCPCLSQLCNGALGSCAADACAPLDADGDCRGSNGAGASVGARANCFVDGAAVVRDTGSVTTAISGAVACTPLECDF